ncbi:MAG: hypothetical protein C4551_04785 [Bacillota bacterium]|nr:MAG: hypothetical protein C4551_04785 [Bacillota bacterium]
MVKRIAAIILIYLAASAAWMCLGVLTEARTQDAYRELHGAVGELWGTSHSQPAPEVYALVPRAENESTGSGPDLVRMVVPLSGSDVRAAFDLDYRRKGLLWFSTYAVDFSGRWQAANPLDLTRDFVIVFRFPTPMAIYDDFSFLVNEREAQVRRGSDGSLEAVVTLEPGEEMTFAAAYRSRGLDSWTYFFGPDVTQVRDFTLTIDTDFEEIDFPAQTISPTTKAKIAGGWRLIWRHENLISGYQVGLEMPHRLNPGPLASRISFFAPLTLLFFFFVIFVLAVLRGVNLHPMHYFFLAAAFFSFHLLFAYLVDHVDVHLAFAAASLVSVGLVVSYLRLVVGNRFAFVEAGLAQLLYLVLFSYTHFLRGFTGLTVTIGAVLTLFVLMQATARVDWDDVFGGQGPKSRPTSGSVQA